MVESLYYYSAPKFHSTKVRSSLSKGLDWWTGMEDNMDIESKAGVRSSSSDDEIQTDDSISNFDVASDITGRSNPGRKSPLK